MKRHLDSDPTTAARGALPLGGCLQCDSLPKKRGCDNIRRDHVHVGAIPSAQTRSETRRGVGSNAQRPAAFRAAPTIRSGQHRKGSGSAARDLQLRHGSAVDHADVRSRAFQTRSGHLQLANQPQCPYRVAPRAPSANPSARSRPSTARAEQHAQRRAVGPNAAIE